MICILIATFLLGFFLDWLELTLIILPLVGPVVAALEFDPVWFTVMFAVCLQTSFLTPPVGGAALLPARHRTAGHRLAGDLPGRGAVHRHPTRRSRDHLQLGSAGRVAAGPGLRVPVSDGAALAASNAPQPLPTARLPRSTVFAYGLPGIGAGSMYLLIGLYVMKFSTDVLLISPLIMGLIFSASRIWDAVSDPLVGYLSDRTRSRYGRRRTWMAASVIPIAGAFVMIFAPPTALSGTGLVIWMAGGRHHRLVLHEDGVLRAAPVARRRTLDQLPRAQPPVRLSARLLHDGLDPLPRHHATLDRRGSGRPGSRPGAGIGTVAARLRGDGRDDPVRGHAAQGAPRIPGPRVRQPAEGVRGCMAQRARTALDRRHADREHRLGGDRRADAVRRAVRRWRPSMAPLVILAYMVPSAASVPLWIPLSRRVGKIDLWMFSMLLTGFSFGGMFALAFIDPHLRLGLMFILAAFAGLAAGCGGTIGPSVQGDVIDYDEHRTGERKEGSYFAAWNFVYKSAFGIMLALTGFVLDLSGFVPNQPQTMTTQVWMLGLYGMFPLICYSIGAALFARFKLDEAAYREIRARLDGTKLNS